MTALVFDFGRERQRRQEAGREWDNTDRGAAFSLLNAAALYVRSDHISEAYSLVRAVAVILERLDGGVTLAQELAEQAARRRRMERAMKGAETRRRNRLARLAAEKRGAS